MYELIKVSDCTYYIDCPARMGVFVRENGEAFLIDSGNDKDAGKKAKRIVEGEGWTLKGILTTHSHADHIGGCNYLQTQTGCKVFASPMESAFATHTTLMPISLYGGNPHKEIRHKDMIAKPCTVSAFDDPDFPNEIKVIDLSGHAPGQVGYKLPDGSVFLADVLCTRQTLDKYAIVYLYDVAAHLESLDRVAQMQIPEGAMFIPAHCPVATDVAELTAYNKEKILEIADFLATACEEPKTLEQLLAMAFEQYNLKMNFAQHELIGSTIRSYLTYLEQQGKVEISITNNFLYYKAI